jgi:hypothetical protein
MLLDRGARIDDRDNQSRTALALAGAKTQVVDVLRAHGAQ